MALLQFKVKEADAAAVNAEDVLRMATVNGAHAMGLADADVYTKANEIIDRMRE